MDFGKALKNLRNGNKVSREGWNGKDMYILLIKGSNVEKTTGDYHIKSSVWKKECLPFIAMKTADDKMVPWLASQTDLLSDDWNIYKNNIGG